VLAGFGLLGVPLTPANCGAAAAIALFAAGVEAVAPHGADNFFLIVLPALLSALWLNRS
jgi:hypothetical protein